MENKETKYAKFWREIEDVSSKLKKSDLLFEVLILKARIISFFDDKYDTARRENDSKSLALLEDLVKELIPYDFDMLTTLKPKSDFLDLVSNAELYSRVAKARLLSRGEPKIWEKSESD